ncbi:hypothetical protein [Psittacicella gerlachiana]|uniref:Uncharacterized protein n=1 Tax=Psittacicella gerlachiana TaxID=2028574 RepID=A0A3A1YET7_9GAMM|nr:hypothetical protein [Psittacicella gerlachiana]RIY36195.1 hypothetical protein CKF59_02865 [Psittacicella gerlachiana]
MKQTTSKPFFIWSALIFIVGMGSLLAWSQSFQAFSGQSWHLFFLAIANVEYATLWQTIFLGFLCGFIPLAITVCTLYFRRKTSKPRFFFAVINLILLALAGWLIFVLTQSSDKVFLGESELKQYFAYSYPLISLFALAWSSFYLAPLYGKESLFNLPKGKFIGYLLLGVVASVISVGVGLSVQQELSLSLFTDPALRYTVSLYAYAGAIGGAIFFLVAVALIKFMQASTAYEERIAREELELMQDSSHKN